MNSRLKLLVVTVSSCLVLFLLLGSLLGRSAPPEDVYSHFYVYTEVLSRIKSQYVEEPDMHDVTLGALNGLLEAIDPYASYLNADQYKRYLNSRDTHKASLGLVLSRKMGHVSVVDAIPGSPAAKAGLTTRDMIETIDGIATRDMPLAYAEILLSGEAGTVVDLTVLRFPQRTEPQEFSLVRQAVEYPAVRSQLLPDAIGYIRVQSLESGKTEEVARRLKILMKQGAEKIILDLRRSAVGDPEEGLALADLFLDEGLIGYLEGQKVARQDFRASREETLSRLPMVVVTNRGTARGAEIAAAALLGNDRCEVVGERSYGDAAVRKAVALNDGSAVILSVAKYYSPEGKALQDTAVTPSVVAVAEEPDPDVEGEEPRIEPQPELSVSEDTVLQKAIEVLNKGPEQVARKENLDEAEQPPSPR